MLSLLDGSYPNTMLDYTMYFADMDIRYITFAKIWGYIQNLTVHVVEN